MWTGDPVRGAKSLFINLSDLDDAIYVNWMGDTWNTLATEMIRTHGDYTDWEYMTKLLKSAVLRQIRQILDSTGQ